MPSGPSLQVGLSTRCPRAVGNKPLIYVIPVVGMAQPGQGSRPRHRPTDSGAPRNTVRDAVRSSLLSGSSSPSRDGDVRRLAAQAVRHAPEGHGAAVAGHRDLIQVRPPAEDEARFFALADNGRVAVLSCVRTGYRAADEGRRRPGSPAPFPADRNVFCISSGQVPPAQPAPAEGCAGLSRRRGYAPREPENGHAIVSRGRGPSDSQRTRCHWVRSRALRQARLGA